MNNSSIIGQIAHQCHIALSKISGHVFGVLTGASRGYLIAALTLYFIVMGYKYIMGEIDTSKKNMFRVFIFLPIILATVFNYSIYLNLVSNPILALRDFLISRIGSIGGAMENGNAFQSLDTIFLNMYTFVNNELMGDFIMNPLDNIIGFIVIAIYLALYIWIGYFMIKGIIATGFFLMIGIVPILFFAFDGTKHITGAWFRTLITYTLYGPLCSIFMIFIYWITLGTASNLENQFQSLAMLIIAGGILILLVKDIPEYANAITGGMSSAQDATGMAGSGFSWGSVGAKKGLGAVGKFKGGN
jgi:hypothetical protein